jgi:hypothetical protein
MMNDSNNKCLCCYKELKKGEKRSKMYKMGEAEVIA